MTFEFNKIEMKTARNLLAEVASRGYSRFNLDDDQLRIEIALKAMDVINKWGIKNYTCEIYRMKFSSLSYDAMPMARGIEANFYKYFEDGDLFHVTTTHDLDSFTFNRSAISHLAIWLLERV